MLEKEPKSNQPFTTFLNVDKEDFLRIKTWCLFLRATQLEQRCIGNGVT